MARRQKSFLDWFLGRPENYTTHPLILNLSTEVSTDTVLVLEVKRTEGQHHGYSLPA